MAARLGARRIKWGILCVPLAGLVYLQSLLVTGEYVSPSDDLRGYAEQVTSARFHFALLIDALQVTLALIGMIALCTLTSRTVARSVGPWQDWLCGVRAQRRT